MAGEIKKGDSVINSHHETPSQKEAEAAQAKLHEVYQKEVAPKLSGKITDADVKQINKDLHSKKGPDLNEHVHAVAVYKAQGSKTNELFFYDDREKVDDKHQRHLFTLDAKGKVADIYETKVDGKERRLVGHNPDLKEKPLPDGSVLLMNPDGSPAGVNAHGYKVKVESGRILVQHGGTVQKFEYDNSLGCFTHAVSTGDGGWQQDSARFHKVIFDAKGQGELTMITEPRGPNDPTKLIQYNTDGSYMTGEQAPKGWYKRGDRPNVCMVQVADPTNPEGGTNYLIKQIHTKQSAEGPGTTIIDLHYNYGEQDLGGMTITTRQSDTSTQGYNEKSLVLSQTSGTSFKAGGMTQTTTEGEQKELKFKAQFDENFNLNLTNSKARFPGDVRSMNFNRNGDVEIEQVRSSGAQMPGSHKQKQDDIVASSGGDGTAQS